ncbi:MAG: hypothetical protein V1921_02475, partial [Candidatus Altiarchaeota archaeon]
MVGKNLIGLFLIFIILSGTASAGWWDNIDWQWVKSILPWRSNSTSTTTTVPGIIPLPTTTITQMEEQIREKAQEKGFEMLGKWDPLLEELARAYTWNAEKEKSMRNDINWQLCMKNTVTDDPLGTYLRIGDLTGPMEDIEPAQCGCKTEYEKADCCYRVLFERYNIYDFLIDNNLCKPDFDYAVNICKKSMFIENGDCNAVVREIWSITSGAGFDRNCHGTKMKYNPLSLYCSETCKCFTGEGYCNKDSQCYSGYCNVASGSIGSCAINPKLTTTTTVYKKYSYRDCHDDDVWWFDSNKNPVEIKRDCTSNQQCIGGSCTGEPTTTTICYNNLYDHMGCDGDYVYWFDSCGNPVRAVENCFPEHGGFCSNGKCYWQGQPVTSTIKTTSSVTQTTTQYTTSLRVITTPTTQPTTIGDDYRKHFFTKCYNGDVWWYDSYTEPVEVYKECDSDEI